jgi:hypothetical protein
MRCSGGAFEAVPDFASVRGAAEEGLAGTDKFPTDEEFLTAAQQLVG